MECFIPTGIEQNKAGNNSLSHHFQQAWIAEFTCSKCVKLRFKREKLSSDMWQSNENREIWKITTDRPITE